MLQRLITLSVTYTLPDREFNLTKGKRCTCCAYFAAQQQAAPKRLASCLTVNNLLGKKRFLGWFGSPDHIPDEGSVDNGAVRGKGCGSAFKPLITV